MTNGFKSAASGSQNLLLARTIPDTRGGCFYRRLLLVVGLASIVGIADQVRALFWRALEGPSTAGPSVPQRLIILAGWIVMCWCAVRAQRSNLAPSAWAIVSLPILIWAYILWPA